MSRYYEPKGKGVSPRFCHLCGAKSIAKVCGRCQRIHGLGEDIAKTPTLTGTTSVNVRRPLYDRCYHNRWFTVVWDGVRRPEPPGGDPRAKTASSWTSEPYSADALKPYRGPDGSD